MVEVAILILESDFKERKGNCMMKEIKTFKKKMDKLSYTT